jgi:hypothetical protein
LTFTLTLNKAPTKDLVISYAVDSTSTAKLADDFTVSAGTVTFAASIALSNLDGIGFKRGVPVSEFSTDSGFTDNATDTVPTENAARIYIERRLGLGHDGQAVTSTQLIPSVTGGFLALNGTLPMKGTITMANNKIVALEDPTSGQDDFGARYGGRHALATEPSRP